MMPDVEVLLLQSRKLGTQEVVVPAGVQRELVVRDDVRALLRLGEVIQDDDRHFGQLQLPRGEKTAVAGDDARPSYPPGSGC